MNDYKRALRAANVYFVRKFDNAEHALHDIKLEEERDPNQVWLNQIFELNEVKVTTNEQDLIHWAKFKKLIK